MAFLVLAAVLVSGAFDDHRTRYQDGQAWADSGRATAACLAEVQAAPQELAGARVPASRQDALVLAQSYAGFARALVTDRDHWTAAARRVETSPRRPDDTVDLDQARARAVVAATRTERFMGRFPSCRFGDPVG